MRTRLKRLYEWVVAVTGYAIALPRRTFRGMAHYAYARRAGLALDEKLVMFEVYRAVKIGDTPYAMFLAMLEDPFYRDFRFIWAIDDGDSPYKKRFAADPRVSFCRFHSRAYARALYRAKYVVNNKAWPSYFIRRPGQVHVTTWHATAFKGLGKEQGGTIGQFRNVTRNYLHADFLVMPNRFTSEVMLRSNDVKGVFSGVVLEEGYPRNDLTLNADRETMRELLREVCGADISRTVVLYAPTWRGETGGYEDTTDEAIANIEALRTALPDDYELLLKVHDLTYRYLAARDDLGGLRCVPDWIDTNELLAGVDILVTDYSSIFFDFMVLERPFIFFAYDLAEYTADRGLYFDMHELPGPVCLTASEVVAAILDIDAVKERYAERYRSMREEFCGNDDGRASERVCDRIFKGMPAPSEYRSFDQGKTRIVAFGCPFTRTKQTFELINLSRHLDYDSYDLTVVLGAAVTPERERYLRMLDGRTRVFYSFGYWDLTFGEHLRRERFRRLPAAARCEPGELSRVRDTYERQLDRIMGSVPFDMALCFTDALTDWTLAMTLAAIPKRVMWLVDATADVDRRMPAAYVREHFDAVFVTPPAQDSRIVRQLSSHEKDAGADGGGSLLRPVERFIGFDNSIGAMHVEELAQLSERTATLLREQADPSKVAHYLEGLGHLNEIIAHEVAGLTEAMRSDIAARQAHHGINFVEHNRKIMTMFYETTGRVR